MATTLYAARGRLIPFNSNSPTGSTFTAFSTYKPMKGRRERYRRFATAADAIRYAVEVLRTPEAFGAHLEVGDERFNSEEIQRLYEAKRRDA